MISPESPATRDRAVERLTALWALSEIGLGGLLHLFKPPFSGVLLAGIAVICISLIAFFSDYDRKRMGRALLIVLIIKMMASPHAGITAYFAVAFQGVLGIWIIRSAGIQWRIYLFAVIALLESAFQKLLVLTILFGMSFWDAMENYATFVTSQFNFISLDAIDLVLTLVIIYFLIYLMAGIFAGRISIELLQELNTKVFSQVDPTDMNSPSIAGKARQTQSGRGLIGRIVFFLFLAIIVTYGLLLGGQAGAIGQLIIRVAAVLIVWFFIINPLFKYALKKWLQKRKIDVEGEFSKVRTLIPYAGRQIRAAWNDTRDLRGFERIRRFLKLAIIQLLTN